MNELKAKELEAGGKRRRENGKGKSQGQGKEPRARREELKQREKLGKRAREAFPKKDSLRESFRVRVSHNTA